MSAILKGEIPTGEYDDARPRIGPEESTTVFGGRTAESIDFGSWASPEDYLEIEQQVAEMATRKLLEGVTGMSSPALDLASSPESPHDSEREPDDKKAMTDLSREELDAKLDRTESRVDAAIARLEAQFGGLRGEIGELKGEMRAEARHNSRLHQITWAVMSIFAVLAIGGAGFVVDAMNTRMDRIETQVDALPAELRGIADSITSAITATQSGQPPVIVIERPTEPPPPEE